MIYNFFARAYKWPEWAISIAMAAMLGLPILALFAAKDGNASPLSAAAWAVLAPALVLFLVDRGVSALAKR